MRMRAGFIGLGTQGKPMAENLAAADCDTLVFDIRPDAVQDLVALGAIAASSPRHVAEQMDIVEICVLDDVQVREVIFGRDGVIAGLTAGKIVVLHSTVSLRLVAEINQAVSAMGASLVDAPVSGGERGARSRTLSFMVGASAEALARCRPYFELSGSRITHAGDTGAGTVAKLAHQMVLIGNMLAAYEGFSLGRAAGISESVLWKVVHEGAAQSGVADRLPDRTLRPGTVQALKKDLDLCLTLARDLGVSAPGASLAQQLIDEILPLGPLHAVK